MLTSRCASSAQLAAARRAEPEARHVDAPGAAVERQVEAEVLRAVVAVADVEPADRRRHLDLRERLRQVGGDRSRRSPLTAEPGQPLAGRDGRQRVARAARSATCRSMPGDAGRAVDAGEGAPARSAGCVRCRPPPRSSRMSSGCSCVVAMRLMTTRSNGSTLSSRMRSQPPPSATTGPASNPKIGCCGSSVDWISDAVAVRVPQLEPPDAREIEDGGEVAELGVGDLELRARPGRRARRRRGRRRLGRQRRQEPDRVAVFQLGEAPERLGDAQVVDREAAADQRPQPHLRLEVGDVEHHRPLGVDDLQALDGDRARRVGDEIDQRAQVPGDAADVHLARRSAAAPLR